VSALVLSKVILLGEYVHLGRRHEERPLIVSTLYKSILFGLLAGVFRIVEDIAKHLLFHESASLFANLNINEMLARTLVMFWAFIPFFAFRETARVLGEGRLFNLFFHRRTAAESQGSIGPAEEPVESRRY
jgi:hypothetical protein